MRRSRGLVPWNGFIRKVSFVKIYNRTKMVTYMHTHVCIHTHERGRNVYFDQMWDEVRIEHYIAAEQLIAIRPTNKHQLSWDKSNTYAVLTYL